jgi:hypothetical protein
MMHINHFTFGVIEISGVTYDHDVIIDCGEIHERKKKGLFTGSFAAGWH